MTISTHATELDILERIRTVCPRVWDSEVPDTTGTPNYPYAVVFWGEPIRGDGGRHITGVRNDVMTGWLTVEVVSRDADSCRAMKDAIKDALVGFRPVDCGELVPGPGSSYSRAGTSTRPTLFYRTVGFEYKTNTKTKNTVE